MAPFVYRPQTEEERARMIADFDHWTSLGYRVSVLAYRSREQYYSFMVSYEWGHCPECDSDDIVMETIDDERGPEFVYCNACGAPDHEADRGERS